MKAKDENKPRKRKATAVEPPPLSNQLKLEEDGIMEIGQEEFYKQQATKKQKASSTNHFETLLSSTVLQELLSSMFSQSETMTLTQLNEGGYQYFSPQDKVEQRATSPEVTVITIEDEEEEEKTILPQTIQTIEPQAAKAPILPIGNEEKLEAMMPETIEAIAQYPVPPVQTTNDRDKEKEKEWVTSNNHFPTTITPQNRKSFFYLDDNKSLQELENSINLSVNGVKVKFQYKSSKIDKPDLVYIAPLNIISSQQTHYGVYARSFIEKGTVLFKYTGEQVSEEEDEDETKDRDYFMLLKHPPRMLDAKYQGNGSRFINDSTTQENVEFREREGRMLVIAARDIFEDEQLLVSYGSNYRFGFKPLFLHPSDNFRSAQDIFAANKHYYHPVPYHFANCSSDLSALGISSEDIAFLPKPIYQMLHNQSIQKYDSFSHLPLPVLKVKDGQFMPLWQQERITLLLMAAYLGKENILKKLHQNSKTDATIQQAISGCTALHLACLGAPLDKNPRDVKKRLAVIDLLLKSPGLDFNDRNNKAPIFTLIDNASPDYLKHVLQKITPSLEEFKEHKRNRFDPFVYALKNNKNTHALVILKYIETTGELANYAEYVKEFVQKELIFTNSRSDLNLIANCNEVFEQMGIPKIVVKIPNFFKPQVAISNDQNRVFRPDLSSNLPTRGN